MKGLLTRQSRKGRAKCPKLRKIQRRQLAVEKITVSMKDYEVEEEESLEDDGPTLEDEVGKENDDE